MNRSRLDSKVATLQILDGEYALETSRERIRAALFEYCVLIFLSTITADTGSNPIRSNRFSWTFDTIR